MFCRNVLYLLRLKRGKCVYARQRVWFLYGCVSTDMFMSWRPVPMPVAE